MCVDEAALRSTTTSPAVLMLLELARRVARVDATVLITGESGVGKECFARLIHEASPRAQGPFVAINCGAITESLIESELFGHARGAFTGATQDRNGLFEAADGGTLLLDEVGELAPAMQVKLLRVLQERELRRVGETRTRAVDVRVIATTHRDLHKGVASRLFRQDLYYRLKVVELHVPALRERREDIPGLARSLLLAGAARTHAPPLDVSPGAMACLVRYPWPGNVRELENSVARAIALADGPRLEVHDLPEEIRRAPRAAAGPVRLLDDVERDHILTALAVHAGHQANTALQLGIGSATLYRKLKRYHAEARAVSG